MCLECTKFGRKRDIFSERFEDLLCTYYFVGGMSEAVSLFRKIPILRKFAESKRIFCLRIGEILLNMQATW